MTNTPEQTLSDLLELGEKATEGEWNTISPNGDPFVVCGNLHVAFLGTCGIAQDTGDTRYANATFIAASKNALPAIREYMEMVKGLRDIGGQMALHLHLVADQLEDKIDARKATELANKFRALSRLGGK